MTRAGEAAGAGEIGTAEAHAKINLRLRVFARDATGFHGVETVLARTSLSDTVTLSEPDTRAARPKEAASEGAASGGAAWQGAGQGVALSVDGPLAEGVPEGPDNLCWQAAAAFLDRAFRRRARPAVHIHLTKRIPMGSGLGGGSADAGATLRLLADRWPRLETRELVDIAGEIGSDVPFALLGVPMALGWERGRRLLPLRPPRPRPALLVCSGIHVSTPEAYGWLGRTEADAGGASVFPGATRLAEWESLERLARNDLEAPVLSRHPELSELLDQLRSSDPAVAAMTGSGSALFAIFRDEMERARARRTLAAREGADGLRILDVSLPV
ncbi:4-(cytidine 5'-diphospho)-2-C-methyl-D-erythritol kinase [Candidatus Palauibacter sp.]|uniref:4-(cytidine 5'-diphospho)-2-C-methyl-D-erythritol kinase n=1 Tax=Candidatus Palauibacter sp. TaxID=3101350 RepID=UPI003D0AAE13